MNSETEFGYKVRQVLNLGTQALAPETAKRLHSVRQQALARQRTAVRGWELAGMGHVLTDSILGHARLILAIMALCAGASGTYVWNAYQQAAENEIIDSALLADELPPAAYLDYGFRAWLDRSSQSSQQQ
jgi:hypothetical protein